MAAEELAQLSKVIFNQAVKNWKEQGKKVVGFFCSYVPEEILHAADILPYRIRPTGCTETSLADVHMAQFNCAFVRSCLEYALQGRYDFLDGVVSTNSCDHIRRLYVVWRYRIGAPYMYFLSVPHKVSAAGARWYHDEIVGFKGSVEKAFGKEITDQRLQRAIAVYNETRDLLNRFYALREGEKPLITGIEAESIVLAAIAMPKEEYNRLLTRLLDELKEREGISGYRARLMVCGSAYDDLGYTEVIEQAGGLVITDTLCFGSRYFTEPVQVDGDPLLALAKSYLSRPACARMSGMAPERWELIKQMAARFRVDGVIFQRMRYCDLWGGESLYLEKKLKEEGIPYLPIEREYRLSGVEQLRTRIEAFLELIERR